jgi:glycosyltransferase involved in cell wall biosynthesis
VIGGGAGAEWLLAAADRHGVGQQLTVTGALDPREATKRLADAVIGLAPYPAQAPFYFCPLKIVDYLAAGLAVVSNDQGDIAHLVGDAGLVTADPDDDRAFAAAVRTLLADDERRCAMAMSGRTRAHETMTWNHVASATADAIVRLVQRVGAPS